MIKIEIKSTDINTKSGVSGKTGKPYTIREQSGYAHTHDRDGKLFEYPVQMKVSLQDGSQPYAPGFYTLAPESLYTNGFQQLAITPVLKPLVSQSMQKAA